MREYKKLAWMDHPANRPRVLKAMVANSQGHASNQTDCAKISNTLCEGNEEGNEDCNCQNSNIFHKVLHGKRLWQFLDFATTRT